MSIHFRPLTSEDLPQLNLWRSEPHVAETWGAPDSDEAEEAEFFRNSHDPVRQFIIEHEGKPIGYFQFYWASQAGSGWWPGYDDHTVGFDLYIGERDLIGKGLGFKIIEQAIQMLFEDQNVHRIIVDPAPTNHRMIHLLKKAGFHDKGEITTPDGQAWLMELKR